MRGSDAVDRRDWLPKASAVLGSLIGAGVGLAFFWLRVRSGAYDHYPGFVGLGEAIREEFGLPILVGAVGMMAGFHIGVILARRPG
jgi:hypothetical protein